MRVSKLSSTVQQFRLEVVPSRLFSLEIHPTSFEWDTAFHDLFIAAMDAKGPDHSGALDVALAVQVSRVRWELPAGTL
jgi:hypothetical protein